MGDHTAVRKNLNVTLEPSPKALETISDQTRNDNTVVTQMEQRLMSSINRDEKNVNSILRADGNVLIPMEHLNDLQQ